MANPPIVGIGIRLTRRALGLSTAPIRKDKRRTNGVSTKARTNVANNDARILYI